MTDLSQVQHVDMLMAVKRADVVIAQWNGDQSILKGEEVLEAIAARSVSRTLYIVTLRLTNSNQCIALTAAILTMQNLGRLTPAGARGLWEVLRDALERAITNRPYPVADSATSYPDAAVRGELREWKTQLATRYRRFERRSTNIDRTLLNDFVRKTGTGRQRTFTKLSRLFDSCATLEGVRLDSTPLALWSLLMPRDTIRYDEDDNEIEQPGVAIHHLLIGALPNNRRLSEGMWTLEVTDHALGRVLHRSTDDIDLTAVVMRAHHNLLQLPETVLRKDASLPRLRDRRWLIAAGSGVFICELIVEGDDDDLSLHFLAKTWISDEMLQEEQVPLKPAGAMDSRLADCWLLPTPLRRILGVKDGETTIEVWARGADLIAATKGERE